MDDLQARIDAVSAELGLKDVTGEDRVVATVDAPEAIDA